MREVRYESPKGRHLSSSWLREDDTNARRVLEQKGWRVVETRAASEGREPAPLQALPGNTVDAVSDYDSLSDERGHTLEAMAARLPDLTKEQHEALLDAGYASPHSVREATDEQLREVPGIGPAAVRNIRKALKAPQEPPEAGDAG